MEKPLFTPGEDKKSHPGPSSESSAGTQRASTPNGTLLSSIATTIKPPDPRLATPYTPSNHRACIVVIDTRPRPRRLSPLRPAHDEVQDRETHGIDAMDAQVIVDAVTAKLSAEPDGLAAEPEGIRSAATGTPNGIRSSPPMLAQDVLMAVDRPKPTAGDAGEKSDSEAETIVLPGKDGHSPSKTRKPIKHEDRSEDEEMRDAFTDSKSRGDSSRSDLNVGNPSMTTATSLGKRKRPKFGIGANDSAHLGNSSGLSSVPTSPVATTRSSLSKPAASDSEVSRSPSPRSRSRSTVRDKAKSVDRALSRRREYTTGSGDEDETELRTFGEQASSVTDHRTNRPKGGNDTNPRKRTRSKSPHGHSHKRSLSTQLPPKPSHGLSNKKKRIPAPLQSTEYHSDESSASGNSHPRSSRLRNLTAPITGDSAISPAKMPPHKKHVNSSGQTLLAIACGRNKLEVVKQRYGERPEDLNLADNAENTPLHTASLMGYEDVVKFLLSTGRCELDCVNSDRDTPLHDAVDNGHWEVVKLLLDAGANPAKPNLAGNKPRDLIDDDHKTEEGEDSDAREERLETNRQLKEMRVAIDAASAKFVGNRRGSEDHQMHGNGDGRMSLPRESPRQTPPANELQNFGLPNRKGTARSRMKTKESNLWTGYGVPELQSAASEGDLETISRVLGVNDNIDDARTLYNAARGGHDGAINLLFALGSFSSDPPELDGVPPDQCTPILAAIGKDSHLEVIKLFLGRPDFDPTRLINGETYHEIAKRRNGPYWQEEEQLLKEAFIAYKKSHKASPGKSRSPGTRRDGREPERDARRVPRSEDQQTPRTHKRSTSNPKTRENEPLKTQNRSTSIGQPKDGQNASKRGPGRPRKEGQPTSGAISDRETSPHAPPRQKSSQSRKSESDAAATSETEPAAKPRRKLVSGKEFRGERELEKQRRASFVSNASAASVKDKRERGPSDTKLEKLDGRASPGLARMGKNSGSAHHDRDQAASDKERARPHKRDDSKDRLSAIRGESPVKRARKSETPPRSGMQEVSPAYHLDGPQQKKQKLAGDATSGHQTDSSSPEYRPAVAKSILPRENTSVKSNSDAKSVTPRPSQKYSGASEYSRELHLDTTSTYPIKPGLSAPTSAPESNSRKLKESTEQRPSKDSRNERTTITKTKVEEEESFRQAQIQRGKREAEAEAIRQKTIAEERERVERERVERERVERERVEQEKIEREKIERDREARLAKERAEREAEETRQNEEKRQREEERRQREEADRKERQRLEEEERETRAMEQRQQLYLEQERRKKEEADRRHAAQAEQKRADQERAEKERREARLARLPMLLRWFDQAFDSPGGHQFAEIVPYFKRIVGYRYDTIRPEFTGQTVGREQWMLNTHAAILLGEQDLKLSRFSAWDRVSLSINQKKAIWSTHNSQFLLYDGLLPLRKALPRPEGSQNEIIQKNKSLFLDLDLFMVKVSEFMFIVPTIPHLRDVELKVEYRELQEPQTPDTVGQPQNLQKWRSDPETVAGQETIPAPKFYRNGDLVRQGRDMTRILKHPPPLDTFPRREGISRVHESDPDYEEQCRKQRLPGYRSSSTSSTNHPRSAEPHTNGMTPPRSDQSKSLNGGSPTRSSESDAHMINGLPNGISNGGSPPPPSSITE
ncbi:hypothetical protein LZ554_006822 [Drepanopeziza brunnea f. sp. 'monogermtubi']|nr:hypothetical protein LZ554_006822 [Drepanopeziza brunnea f. sp. 'monogermtubi']